MCGQLCQAQAAVSLGWTVLWSPKISCFFFPPGCFSTATEMKLGQPLSQKDVCVCMCMHHLCRCPQRPQERFRSLQGRLTDSLELPDSGTGIGSSEDQPAACSYLSQARFVKARLLCVAADAVPHPVCVRWMDYFWVFIHVAVVSTLKPLSLQSHPCLLSQCTFFFIRRVKPTQQLWSWSSLLPQVQLASE